MSEVDNTQVIVDTATRATKPDPLLIGTVTGAVGLYSVIVPAGATQVTINTEEIAARYRVHPWRKTGTVNLTTPASLSHYVGAHKTVATELYGTWRERRVVAVLNDHAAAAAGWGDHRAILTLAATPEWLTWEYLDGKYLSQVEFAEHIINTTADIVSPDAADLLEMAETFSATKSVAFKSGSRLRDGQRQLTYVEEISAGGGTAGTVSIPDHILLTLAPFDGADPVDIGARIRYRIGEGSLRIGYVLDRPDLVLREAFERVVATVEQATGITAMAGTARS